MNIQGLMNFYIIDVFTEQKYSGNQLAAFLARPGLEDREMQAIAREMNFSETVFLSPESVRGEAWKARIFTPVSEVPFAGHPVLGAAHIIRNELSAGLPDSISLILAGGTIPVTCQNRSDGPPVYWMKQFAPEFGRQRSPFALAPVLGLSTEDFLEDFPVEEVSTGLPHIIVPLKNLDVLRHAAVCHQHYQLFCTNTWNGPILVWCPQSHLEENHISTRMFAPCFGIPEDAATGSGGGCLAAYLLKHRFQGPGLLELRSEQGFEMGRPSLLHLKAMLKDGESDVYVGGSAVTVAQGRFE